MPCTRTRVSAVDVPRTTPPKLQSLISVGTELNASATGILSTHKPTYEYRPTRVVKHPRSKEGEPFLVEISHRIDGKEADGLYTKGHFLVYPGITFEELLQTARLPWRKNEIETIMFKPQTGASRLHSVTDTVEPVANSHVFVIYNAIVVTLYPFPEA